MKNSADRERLDGIINALYSNTSCRYKLSIPDVLFLVTSARDLFITEPTVLELHTPINICGDIHGQFPDLLRIFELDEKPPNAHYLFLGDYVDRGPMGLEVICLLLALKLRFPNHVFMIRGNHETKEMTEQYGFCEECVSKTNRQVYTEFCTMFENIPIAALVGRQIFCVHGGITPTLSTINQVREIKRPADASLKGFLADLLWSDPNPDLEEFGPNDRGDTVAWGLKPAKAFLENNGLTLLVRAHQMTNYGFEYPFEPDESVLTVFSAPCYAGEYKNRGAFIKIDKGNVVTPIVLPHEPNSMAAANKLVTPRPESAGGRGGKKGRGGKNDRGGKGGKNDKGGKRGRRK
ncbi:Ser/Thr protein phosphatase [Tritrichomonas foetus]|uniref:Serine/threonine-protein phosphatase n=1 Tax=Tritrichomonas foetus TaxID=1144522 RepID=A0A1J4JD09_9EUKA|nr:Ser/Thr protein phosphatase [Tritrichomonas foetus]|eukprot:OHS95555.1 Ser/Thr protein phosphatase [Tritrichomonas foetus]